MCPKSPSPSSPRITLVPGPRVALERQPTKSKGSRRLFVGDIQGCFDELQQLLNKLDFKPGYDRLFPVGDLVNRGPQSAEVLRFLAKLDARPVLGNHDLHLLDVARGKRHLSKNDTLDQLLASEDASSLLDWLASQPLCRIHKDLYQVHAGLHPAWTTKQLVEQALAPACGDQAENAATFITHARYCDQKGILPARGEALDSDGNPTSANWRPWYEFFDPSGHGGRSVIYGHWAMMGIVDRDFTIGLDSGVVWGGALTAYIPEEHLLLSVPAAKNYAGHFRPR